MIECFESFFLTQIFWFVKLILFRLISKILMRCFRIQKIRFQMNVFLEFDLVLRDSLHQFYLIELFFLTFLKLFFFISLIERRWERLRKKIKKQKILFFFSPFFESRSRVQKKEGKRKLVFYRETVSTTPKELFYKRIDLFSDNIPETLIIQNLYNISGMRIV